MDPDLLLTIALLILFILALSYNKQLGKFGAKHGKRIGTKIREKYETRPTSPLTKSSALISPPKTSGFFEDTLFSTSASLVLSMTLGPEHRFKSFAPSKISGRITKGKFDTEYLRERQPEVKATIGPVTSLKTL